MWEKYDENLNINPFLKDILNNHKDLIRKCSEESWIICVPRIGTLEEKDLIMDCFLDHILIASKTTENEYCTLSKKRVTVKNKRIESCELFTNSVEILFEETFYMEKTLKYVVWCIDSALFNDYFTCDAHNTVNLETLHDCIDFLWVESLGHDILEHIQKLVDTFLQEQNDLETDTLQTQKDLIGNLYSHCLQIALKNHNLQSKTTKSDLFFNNLKVAVETYMQYCLSKKIMYGVNSVTYQKDSYFNKIVRNSTEIQSNDLNISNEFSDSITFAKCELIKINCFATVLDKISCLKRTFNSLTNLPDGIKCNKRKHCITSDEILQLLVFLILKLNVSNWIGNLVYMKEFRFSVLEHSDQNYYFITSLEAAIEYIQSNQFLDIKNKKMKLFDNIKLCDLEAVKKVEKVETKKVVRNLCHPLCNCENCAGILKDSNVDNYFSILPQCNNEKGQDLLICATISGNCAVVQYLLNEGFQVDVTDFCNKTALHYAASKGYQNILLLLLNAKANVNALDNDENTPLHLACDKGHDNCVKAILYSSTAAHVNISNINGETPLQLATKWNYTEIIKLLLEHNANPNTKNKRNKTCQDLATNYHVAKLFEISGFEIVHPDDLTKTNQSVNNENNNNSNNLTNECKDHGIRPKNIEQFKKIDLLLKSIENNDFPLTCFYLGFNNFVSTDQSLGEKCHPLCNCPKCEALEFDFENNFETSFNHININTCNIKGLTPLHVAAKFGRMEILRLLLDSCALPNVRTYKTLFTPLHLACIHQRVQAVKELLKCGDCQIDAQDYKGNTPLYYACIKNDAKIVEILLSNGADGGKRNFTGKSVMQETEGKIQYRIFKMLKSNLVNGLVRNYKYCNDDDDNDWLV